MTALLATILLSYLVGSIPTSIIVGKVFRHIDIRQHGSGNAGATNVIRVMGWKLGVLVMLVDAGKGVMATLYIARIAAGHLDAPLSLLQIIAGTCAVIGHIFTVFAGFRGGKGVATGAGMIYSLYPIPALVCTCIFAAVVLATRYVSLGSIAAAVSLPVVLFIFKLFSLLQIDTPLFFFALVIVLLILFAHRGNIKRLLSGRENRIGRKKSAESPT